MPLAETHPRAPERGWDGAMLATLWVGHFQRGTKFSPPPCSPLRLRGVYFVRRGRVCKTGVEYANTHTRPELRSRRARLLLLALPVNHAPRVCKKVCNMRGMQGSRTFLTERGPEIGSGEEISSRGEGLWRCLLLLSDSFSKILKVLHTLHIAYFFAYSFFERERVESRE